MSQQNFPFNISFFYQYWYKRSVLWLFKTDYGDSLSAERISLQQRWCSGKLSACLPWYTYCQVSTIFASEFRRKEVVVKKIFSITYSFKLAFKKSLLLWSVIKYPCSLQEQTLFNFRGCFCCCFFFFASLYSEGLLYGGKLSFQNQLGLYLEGNLRLKIDWASIEVKGNFCHGNWSR